jgi:hypothetical protein
VDRVDWDTRKWFEEQESKEFNPDRVDFIWNEDFTKFRAIPLKWWNDASYIVYQCDEYFRRIRGFSRSTRL